MRLASAPRVVGPHAPEFSLTSECFDGQLLVPGAACSITLRFHPAAQSSGLRTAALQIDHDWVASPAAVALLGVAISSATPAPDPADDQIATASANPLCGTRAFHEVFE